MTAKIYAPRGADLTLNFAFPENVSFLGYDGAFSVYSDLNGTILLTFSTDPSTNGSQLSFTGNNITVSVKKDDIDALPVDSDDEQNPSVLFFDFMVTSPADFTSKIYGGAFIVKPFGASITANGDEIDVSIDGQVFEVTLEGGTSYTIVPTGAVRFDVTQSLSDIQKAQARENSGSVINVDVQAYSVDLAAIAALTSGIDKIPYSTAAETWAMAPFTAAGRAVVGGATAALQRTALGLGNVDNTSDATKVTAGPIKEALDLKRSIADDAFLEDYYLTADAGDYGLTFARAIAAGVKTIRAKPKSSPYSISTPVTLPQGSCLVGVTAFGGSEQVTFQTTQSITMFTASGSTVGFDKVALKHLGSAGRVFDGGQYDGHRITDCHITGEVTGNPDSIVYIAGSLTECTNTSFTNLRTGASAYAYVLDRTSGHISIENAVEGGVWGGPGHGIWIGSSDGSARPEGIHLIGLKMFGTGHNLTITSCLYTDCDGCTFDQGNGKQVILKPSNDGIDSVCFRGCYIATNTLTSSSGVYHDTSGGANMSDIIFIACDFMYSATSLDLSAPSNVKVLACKFADSTTGIYMNGATRVNINGNYFTNLDANLTISDGASGGPYIIESNDFDPTAQLNITQTDPNKFFFGKLNTGLRVADVMTVLTGTDPASGSYVNVPNTLAGTPTKRGLILQVLAESGLFIGPVSGDVVAIDASNVTVQLSHGGIVTSGTLRINVEARI